MNVREPVYDQYEEFEERDPRKKLNVSEAYQIEDLKRDRAYLKREIAKNTTEKHEVINLLSSKSSYKFSGPRENSTDFTNI